MDLSDFLNLFKDKDGAEEQVRAAIDMCPNPIHLVQRECQQWSEEVEFM